MGRFLVGAAVIVVALLGVAASFGVPRRPAADPKVKFPWSGPVDSVRILAGLRGDRLLTFSIYGNAYFWFLGVIEVLLINILGKIQFGLSDAVTSYLVGAQLVGVAIGGLTGGWLARGRRWYRVVPPAALATGVLLMAVVSVPYMPVVAQLPALFAFFAGAGLAGGVVLIPLEGFIQARPPADRKGTVFAAANFVAFSAMLASGPLANVLIQNALPTWSLAIMGELTVFASVWFYREVGREDRKC
jgi:MFS family permease